MSELSDYLAEYAEGVVQEWMRLIDIPDDIQARVTWLGDDEFRLEMMDRAEIGHFRLKVTVEPVDVPPIGPENDPAQIEEMKDSSCSICGRILAQPEDPLSVDCGGDCLGCMIEAEKQMDTTPDEWVASTWAMTALGDRVRIGESEAVIEGFSRLPWHSIIEKSFHKPDGKWWDSVKPFEHTQIHVKLAHLPEVLSLPATGEVEILCSVTRKAMLALGGTFPASE